MVKITLKSGREGAMLRRHPWIFSGGIKNVEGNPVDGQTVEVLASDGAWLARGSYSSQSQIKVRVLSFNPDEPVNRELIKKRITRAIALRRETGTDSAGDAFRLIYAESDGLPGVIADRYGDFLVCQFLSAGAEFWKNDIVEELQEQWPCAGIYERSDTDSRQKEGLQPAAGLLAGKEPPQLIAIREGTREYLVNVYNGHKTGFYLDQRVNRELVAGYAGNREVLNAFSYTGGFGVAAAKGNAAGVSNVDTSEEALGLAKQNFSINRIKTGNIDFIREDVFTLLRKYRDSRREFDLIILDPPKFVSSASQLAGGARGYKDINLLAFKLLRPGGILATFSCSGYVKPELFSKIVSDAAIDAGRDAIILENMMQAPDHPVTLNFPEGLYLKGLLCRVS